MDTISGGRWKRCSDTMQGDSVGDNNDNNKNI